MGSRVYPGWALLAALLLIGPIACGNTGVWEELHGSEPCGSYRPMSAAQISQAQSLFAQTLRNQKVSRDWLAGAWSGLGYGPVSLTESGSRWLGLRDLRPTCRGQGFFLVNTKPRKLLILQAPHAFHDLFTGEVAGRLLHPDVALIGWNSAKRRIGKGDSAIGADLAKRPDSLLLALTRAAAEHPESRLIQIHGFGQQHRKTQEGASSAVIVSSGSRWSSPAVGAVAECLRGTGAGPVRVYPREVDELGATGNIHGRTLRRRGHQGFVHLEFSLQLRKRLRSETALRAAFSECLVSGMH